MKLENGTTAPQVFQLAYATAGRRRRRWPLWTLAASVLAISFVSGATVLSLQSRRHGCEIPSRLTCASNLRQIGQGVQMYANENHGAFPPDVATLLLTQELTSDAFVCGATNDTRANGPTTQAVAVNLTAGGHLSYVYTGNGLSPQSPPDAVVASELLSNHRDGMNVLFADGHVQWLSARQGQTLIAELAAGHNPPRPEMMR
jgi:prepilin-type processing-associated H-X9-DG protein